ncbi:MAG: amidohydrolase [Proteobacteria bacterium]|nr:amidohydrolase [Pseudomonadota bacterium]MBU1742888.1 amidohydrolase [Pseudomonadota bacterium]
MSRSASDGEIGGGRSRRRFLKTTIAAGVGLVAGRARARPTTPSADLVLTGGRIHTLDRRDAEAQALAVRGERILAVGRAGAVQRHISRRTTVVNLRGRTVTPGLIDAHAHLPYFGLRESGLWLNLQRILVRDQVLARLADRARRTPAGEWIHAWGVESIDLGYLDRSDLDRISAKHPILVLHTGGQWGVANSAALTRAGVTRDTVSPPGGRIVKGFGGRPTGLLINYPAINLVRRHVPRPTAEQRRQALIHAAQAYAQNGVTSVQDNFVYVFDRPFQQTYFQLASEGKLPVQVRLWPYLPSLAAAVLTAGLVFPEARVPSPWLQRAEGALAQRYGVAGQDLRRALDRGLAELRRTHARLFTRMWGGFKMAVDGGGPTSMWYDNRGRAKPLHRPWALRRMVHFLHGLGQPISVHAVGDEAVDLILKVLEEALRTRPGAGHRHRIEHALAPTRAALDKMQRLRIGVCHHPQWFWDWGHKFVRLDSPRSWARGRPIMPSRSFLERGIPLAFGADPPAHSEYRPQVALFEAVARVNKSGHRFGGNQTLSIKEALRVQTMGGASLAGEERDKGSLEKGKLADLVVWDTDLLAAKPKQIRRARALLTVCRGRVIHRAGP